MRLVTMKLGSQVVQVRPDEVETMKNRGYSEVTEKLKKSNQKQEDKENVKV